MQHDEPLVLRIWVLFTFGGNLAVFFHITSTSGGITCSMTNWPFHAAYTLELRLANVLGSGTGHNSRKVNTPEAQPIVLGQKQANVTFGRSLFFLLGSHHVCDKLLAGEEQIYSLTFSTASLRCASVRNFWDCLSALLFVIWSLKQLRHKHSKFDMKL